MVVPMRLAKAIRPIDIDLVVPESVDCDIGTLLWIRGVPTLNAVGRKVNLLDRSSNRCACVTVEGVTGCSR
ncbi:hypothetical protein GCM10022420_012510 [Streptomyces iranensis]